MRWHITVFSNVVCRAGCGQIGNMFGSSRKALNTISEQISV